MCIHYDNSRTEPTPTRRKTDSHGSAPTHRADPEPWTIHSQHVELEPTTTLPWPERPCLHPLSGPYDGFMRAKTKDNRPVREGKKDQ